MAFPTPRPHGKKPPQGRGMGRGSNSANFDRVSGTGNGRSTPSPATAPKQSESFAEDARIGSHLHDRMLFLLGSLVGTVVQVTVTDGTVFEGVFHGASTDDELGVTLSLARKIDGPSGSPTGKEKTSDNPVMPLLLVSAKDLVEINAKQVDLTASEDIKETKDKFKTDTQISGQSDNKERVLQKWESDGNMEEMIGLEDNTTGGWDQFAANEKLFGLKTDFDEEKYTTPLNRNAHDFREREKLAIKQAAEIQKSSTNNPHMLEERGAVVDDSGMDEEDRYGAVVRDPNAYVPPALRKVTLRDNLRSDAKRSQLPSTEPSKNIEAEVAQTFGQFVKSEKAKRDKIDPKITKSHATRRRVIEEGLKKFHQEFKLPPVPIPADLLPLLSKNSSSVQASSPAASPDSTTKPAAAPVPEKQATVPPATAPASRPDTTSAASPAKAPEPKFKFNVNASEFKPNPAAPAFVPGMKLSSETSFDGRSIRKTVATERLVLADVFVPSLSKGKVICDGPRWNFGDRQYQQKLVNKTENMYAAPTHFPPGYPFYYSYHRPQFMQPIPQVPFNGSPPPAYVTATGEHLPHGAYPPQSYPYQPHPRPHMMHQPPTDKRKAPPSAPSSTTDSPPSVQSPSSK